MISNRLLHPIHPMLGGVYVVNLKVTNWLAVHCRVVTKAV